MTKHNRIAFENKEVAGSNRVQHKSIKVNADYLIQGTVRINRKRGTNCRNILARCEGAQFI